MLIVKNVFGILTLQTTTILLSSSFITMAICVLLVNALALHTDDPLAWIIILLIVVYTIVTWSISFYGAYYESEWGITIATILWTIYAIIWIKLVIYSFIDAQTICLENRCPDVLWLLSNPSYEKRKECNKVFRNSLNNNTPSLYEKTNKPQMYDNRIKNETKRDKKQLINATIVPHYATVPSAKFGKYENRSEIETNKIKLVIKKCIEAPVVQDNRRCYFISGIVIILYSLLLLFSWIILVSYREEIILQEMLTDNIIR